MGPHDAGGARKREEAEAAANPCAACEIRDLSFCAVLSPTELERLRAITTDLRVEAHRTIVSETEPADHLFNVTAGAVKLYKLLMDGRRQITGFLFPGDFLGVALNDRYVYSAEAITPVSMCRYDRARLEGLLDEMPALEKRLLGITANELVAAQDQMVLLGRKTAQERVASFLLDLSRRASRRGQAPDPIYLPMTRADIADYLGLTVETVSRTFSRLRKLGVIALEGNEMVRLVDRAALEELSEGE
ncbi:MAG: helix-turn-helix domain-containing protein [Alphaproteobacteria bacterium]